MSARRSSSAALASSVPVFAALGDATRLRLVTTLAGGGTRSITELTAETEMTRQAVTKHLDVLAEAGLVRDVREGRERRWRFEPKRLDDARRSLEVIGAQWEHALGSLARHLEREPD